MLTKKDFVAPKKKFRVICTDTFDGTSGIEGDRKTLQEAKELANEKVAGKEMFIACVYNDKGVLVYSTGLY